MSHFFNNDLSDVRVNGLRNGRHDAHFHQRFDHIGAAFAHTCRQFLNRDGFGNDDFTVNFFGGFRRTEHLLTFLFAGAFDGSQTSAAPFLVVAAHQSRHVAAAAPFVIVSAAAFGLTAVVVARFFVLERRFGAVLFRGFGFFGTHRRLLRTDGGFVELFGGTRRFGRLFHCGHRSRSGSCRFFRGFRGGLFGFFIGFCLFAGGAFGGFFGFAFGTQAGFLLSFRLSFLFGFHRRLQNFQTMRFFTVQSRRGIGTYALDIAVSVGYERTLFAHFDLNGFVASARHAVHAVHVHRFFQPQSGTGKSQRSSFVFIVSVCHK